MGGGGLMITEKNDLFFKKWGSIEENEDPSFSHTKSTKQLHAEQRFFYFFFASSCDKMFVYSSNNT